MSRRDVFWERNLVDVLREHFQLEARKSRSELEEAVAGFVANGSVPARFYEVKDAMPGAAYYVVRRLPHKTAPQHMLIQRTEEAAIEAEGKARSWRATLRKVVVQDKTVTRDTESTACCGRLM